jgi:hypothetical protein
MRRIIATGANIELCATSHSSILNSIYDAASASAPAMGDGNRKLSIAGGAAMAEPADPNQPTYEELKAKLAELEKQVQGRKRGALDFKVSEKGGMSVYGLGRFPVTLYYEQWIRLLDQVEQIRQFLEANKSSMHLKHTD